MTNAGKDCDIILVGAGIMSATLAGFITLLEPDWSVTMFEKLDGPARESTGPWNNAGTGHSALCELNYTPQDRAGRIDIVKAVAVNEQFQLSRQFWAALSRDGHLDAATFIHRVPHMSFVRRPEHVRFLAARHQALAGHPLFPDLRFSDQPDVISEWAPLIMEGRDRRASVAATFSEHGVDIDFGALTEGLLRFAEKRGLELRYGHEITGISRETDGRWRITARTADGTRLARRARFVFLGAGGGSLPLLQKSGIREARGYAGFPISGQFLRTRNPRIVERHLAKVYGQAALGAPPMSMPHLDTRLVAGEKNLMFGPYAGWSPKFLKSGSYLDLPTSCRAANLLPMLAAGLKNLGLVKYLVGELSKGRAQRLESLREFYPLAEAGDWELITAGQRVQVIKPAPGGGALQFGTEVVIATDGALAGLLGASPGASTAAPIMLKLLARAFPQQFTGPWAATLDHLIPTRAAQLSDDPALAARTMRDTAIALGLAA
ncbi:MAG: malate dehydrogenase (quinone) [Desulfobulbaceae bacterium]|nr:malate dehydrogenase (quinone) [Desulfobulbaceae bacterium]